MGRGVGVAAADDHARLGEAELGADHVDYALEAGVGPEVADPVATDVVAEGAEHGVGQRISERALPGGGLGGDDVVDGGDGAAREGDVPAQLVEHREGLGARDLVDEVEPDEELGAAILQGADGV